VAQNLGQAPLAKAIAVVVLAVIAKKVTRTVLFTVFIVVLFAGA
jgi:hypothetical protein